MMLILQTLFAMISLRTRGEWNETFLFSVICERLRIAVFLIWFIYWVYFLIYSVWVHSTPSLLIFLPSLYNCIVTSCVLHAEIAKWRRGFRLPNTASLKRLLFSIWAKSRVPDVKFTQAGNGLLVTKKWCSYLCTTSNFIRRFSNWAYCFRFANFTWRRSFIA